MLNWFKSYGDFTEWVDFDYWWSFSGEGSASAACAAGLFLCKGTFFSFDCIPVVLHESFFVCFDGVLEGNWQLEFCRAGALDPQLVGLRPVVFVEVG